jgi:hypothetical protein
MKVLAILAGLASVAWVAFCIWLIVTYLPKLLAILDKAVS